MLFRSAGVQARDFDHRRVADAVHDIVENGVKNGMQNGAGRGHPDLLNDSAAASWVPRKGCGRPAQYVDNSCGRNQAPEPEWADSAQVGKPISSRLDRKSTRLNYSH